MSIGERIYYKTDLKRDEGDEVILICDHIS